MNLVHWTKLQHTNSAVIPHHHQLISTDLYLSSLSMTALLKDIPALTAILTYHVVADSVRPTRNGRSYDTVNGKEISVKVTVDTCQVSDKSCHTRWTISWWPKCYYLLLHSWEVYWPYILYLLPHYFATVIHLGRPGHPRPCVHHGHQVRQRLHPRDRWRPHPLRGHCRPSPQLNAFPLLCKIKLQYSI